MKAMVKINVIIGFLAVISAFLNLWVGINHGRGLYTQTDVMLASVQIVFAVFLIVTGFSRIKKIYSFGLLSRLHFPAAVLFYGYGLITMTMIFNRV